MIGEAVGAVVTEDDVIEQGDAEELAGLPEAGSQGAVFGARSRIAGRVIVLCGVANYVEFLHTDASAPA